MLCSNNTTTYTPFLKPWEYHDYRGVLTIKVSRYPQGVYSVCFVVARLYITVSFHGPQLLKDRSGPLSDCSWCQILVYSQIPENRPEVLSFNFVHIQADCNTHASSILQLLLVSLRPSCKLVIKGQKSVKGAPN